MTAKFPRAGDLLSQVYLYDEIAPITYDDASHYNTVSVPISAAWYTDALGLAKIKEAELQIGQHTFDKQTGEYMEMVDSIMAPPEKALGSMIGKYPTVVDRIYASQNTQRLYTPFRWWFCNFLEQSLPMLGLYWHDVNTIITQRPLSELYHVSGDAVGHVTVPTSPNETYLLALYVYLDKIERASFANGKHEYIFGQVQYLGEDPHRSTDSAQNHSIRYNHPVQEILWVMQRSDLVNGGPTVGNNWFSYQGMPANEAGVGPTHDTAPFDRATILLNNHERTIDHYADYYRHVQQWEKHSRLSASNRWIYGYSFGLRPENLLDTGSTNMSRMDQAIVRVTYPTSATRSWTGSVRFYGRSRNLCKNTIGMMGVKFAA